MPLLAPPFSHDYDKAPRNSTDLTMNSSQGRGHGRALGT